MPIPILFSWSGGKDSALALHALLEQPQQWDVVALLTSVSDESVKSLQKLSSAGSREGFGGAAAAVSFFAAST